MNRILPKITTLVMTPVFMVLLASGTPAAPLDPSQVPPDAKWIVHVDFKALGETQLADQIRENRRHLIFVVQTWLRNRYGLDPQSGFDSLTAYSNSYQPHSGTLILKASFDRQVVQSRLEQKPNVKKTTWGEHTVYTLPIDSPKRRLGELRDDNREARTGNRSDAASSSTAQHAGSINILLLENTLIAASSPENVRAAIERVQGKGTVATKSDAPLLSKWSEGVIVYGAAHKLEEIKQHDGFFPILSQHEKIFLSVGVKEHKVFKDLTLIARNEEVAEDMKSALEGLNSLAKVWAADSENLKKLVMDKEITRTGTTVELNGHSDSETVLKAFDELGSRFADRFGLDSEQHKQP